MSANSLQLTHIIEMIQVVPGEVSVVLALGVRMASMPTTHTLPQKVLLSITQRRRRVLQMMIGSAKVLEMLDTVNNRDGNHGGLVIEFRYNKYVSHTCTDLYRCSLWSFVYHVRMDGPYFTIYQE
jgi:hypothetical protein